MGVPAQPLVTSWTEDRRGLALPASLLGVVAIGLLAAGAWVAVDLNARSASNREASARALQVAEAGMAHALSVVERRLDEYSLTRLLVGSDSVAGTSDDGLLVGYDIPVEEAISASGFTWGDGSYVVTLLDDPGEGDGDPLRDRNGRIIIRCTGRLGDGSRSTVDVIYGSEPIPPAVIVDGDMAVGGSVELLGTCGGLYGNGALDLTGTLVVENGVASTDTVYGSVEDPQGKPLQPLVHQPPISMPDYSALWETCDGADYVLKEDGQVIRSSTGETLGGGALGWSRQSTNPSVWELDAKAAVSASYCVQGNARISGNLGQKSTEPFAISVMATGSISLTGNANIQPVHPDGYMLIAAGDLKIAGNPETGTTERYGGILYAGSQCAISGNPRLYSRLICADDPNPVGAVDEATGNSIDGNARFVYECPPVTTTERRAIAWFQRFGE